MRKKLVTGALAAALTALVGLQGTAVAAQSAEQTWSIVAHFEYQSGFSFDYTVARGVSAVELRSYLQYCGSAHGGRPVVLSYCYPVAE